MKKFFISCLLALMPLLASAVKVRIDGIWYNLDVDKRTAEVTRSSEGSATYDECFDYVGNVVIPATVQYEGQTIDVLGIGEYAFFRCKALTSVAFPNSLTNIGQDAFSQCTNLNGVTIPEKLRKIGSHAFSHCSSLTSIVIPQNVDDIGACAFEYTGLTSVALDARKYNSMGHDVFANCKNLTSVTIGENITFLGASMFGGCVNLKSIEIPENIVSWGSYGGSRIFENCTSLTSVTLPDNMTIIPSNMFDGCTALTSIDIPESVTEIETSAFAKSGLTSITIPKNVTRLYPSCFYDCKHITSVVIPDNVTDLGEDLFWSCTALESVTIGSGVSHIDNNMFDDCTSLKTITIPDNVESIGENVFNNCIRLESIKIGSGVLYIGNEMFNNCTNLTDVYFYSKQIPYFTNNRDPFKGFYPEEATLYVQDSLYFDYKSADKWKEFGTIKTLSGEILSYTNKLVYMVDSVEYKSYDVDYKTSLTPEEVPVKEGHTFSGWDGLPETMPWHDVTVYGSFIPNKYTVIWQVDGEVVKSEQVTYGSVIPVPETPVKEGHTFSGWDTIPETMPAKDLTLTGVCTPNKYTIAYMLDGSLLQTDTITYGNSVTPCQVPEKEGYTFSGWSGLPATMPATDLVINGAYTINKYCLTYLVDGAVYKEHEVTYNDTIIAEAAPVKDGYRFGGWSEIPVRMPAHDVQVDGVFIEIVYCDRPVISYADGQLTFTSQTEGVEFVSSITCDDVNTYRDAQVALSVAYNVSVYATKEGCENSDTVTAVLCWIECDHQDEEEKGILKVASTPALIQSSNGIITIEGLEKGTSVSVYTTSGMEVASGVAEENVTLIFDTQMTKGEVAIVKMGAKSVKVMMK